MNHSQENTKYCWGNPAIDITSQRVYINCLKYAQLLVETISKKLKEIRENNASEQIRNVNKEKLWNRISGPESIELSKWK